MGWDLLHPVNSYTARKATMAKRENPTIVIAYWDTSDPSNKGWAWRAIWYSRDGERQHEESGGFEGRSSLSETAIQRRAREAAGFTRIPVEINY
jgi:hypothetical protein